MLGEDVIDVVDVVDVVDVADVAYLWGGVGW